MAVAVGEPRVVLLVEQVVQVQCGGEMVGEPVARHQVDHGVVVLPHAAVVAAEVQRVAGVPVGAAAQGQAVPVAAQYEGELFGGSGGLKIAVRGRWLSARSGHALSLRCLQ